MRDLILKAIDFFVPEEITRDQASLTSVRAFVLLHLLGPAMGHSVVLFLWTASPKLTWQFWVVEAGVASFWFVPFLMKFTRSLTLPAMVSVQALVFLSLFGSFYYGGISSPFMPWLIIALLLGFFYLAARAKMVLAGVSLQLALFVGARLMQGDFVPLLPMSSLTYVNLISVMAAIVYTTLLSLYYETVMRESGALEQATRTHRMQTEALGNALRQAEEASRHKSIFLAKISHELRTPLNAVIGYSEMLRDELSGEETGDQRAIDLERINVAGRHLLALVTEVLDLKNIEHDSVDLVLKKVEIAQLIRDVTATAGPLIAKKRNQLVVQIAGDIGTMETDPLKLRQSILNLLSNAAKFTSQGVIRLNLARKTVNGAERLLIEVHDTGIGMSPEGMSKIFKNFVQSEQDTAQKFGGTGLGLTLTKRFCGLMGGTISVASQPGQGSTFTIDIPYNGAEGDAAVTAKDAIRLMEASAA